MTNVTKPTPNTPPKPAAFVAPDELRLDTETYAYYMNMVEVFGRRTGIRLHVDIDETAMQDGDIFLFNHFTRFETLVPPYLLLKHSGKMTRSVAHAGLFKVNDMLSRILRQTGGVPHNMPGLLPFLAEEILRGRKVVLFPEGGMVKDHHVLDARGRYMITLPDSHGTRPLHRGAAVLALMLDLLKRHIAAKMDAGDHEAIGYWTARLGLDEAGLRVAVAKPTLIVPGNITFYPMRIGDNVLSRGLSAFIHNTQALDELRIEGNLLFKRTDMNIRFGRPIFALHPQPMLREAILERALRHVTSTEEVFALSEGGRSLLHKQAKRVIDREVDRIRTEYAHRIYRQVTVNINHLAATLIAHLAETGVMAADRKQFHTALYLAMKALQQDPRVHLHHSLLRPEEYDGLLAGESAGFMEFMDACAQTWLVKRHGNEYRISHRLEDVQDFHAIREENPVAVHVNESSPIPQVKKAVARAWTRAAAATPQELAKLRFDDMLRDYHGMRYKWGKRAPESLVAPDKPEFAAPYMLVEKRKAGKAGVLLLHGFAAHSGELRAFGDSLYKQGHPVLGVRLPGHGTSYYDMERFDRHDWRAAVRQALDVLSAFCDRVVVVGFSTGGALALNLAAENDPRVAGVATVAAPVMVHDRNIHILPVITPLHKLLRRLPFCRNALRLYPYSKEPDAAYTRVPVLGLNQLRLLIAETVARMPKVTVPLVVLQGLSDHTVKAQSATIIYNATASKDKTLRWIAGGPHALIGGNHGMTWQVLSDFVAKFDRKVKA